MSQPIDTAYVEIQPDLDNFGARLQRRLTDALNRLQTSVDRSMTRVVASSRRAADQIGAQGATAGQQFGDGFTRDVTGRLRDSRTQFHAAGTEAGSTYGRALSSGLAGVGRQLASAVGSVLASTGEVVRQLAGLSSGASAAGTLGTLVSIFASLSGAALSLVGALAAAAAAMALIAPTAQILGGSVGALPGLFVGVAAAVATLGLGLHGIAGAFAKSTAAGGGAARSASAVRGAEMALTRALRDQRIAQDAVNVARKTAAERLQDLTRDVTGARNAEERATRDLERAERQLQAAQESGDPAAIAEAELALREQQHALDEAKDRTEDLGAEQVDAARKGVEGSDEVTAALRRQQDATDAVKSAQLALQDAQRSGGGGGGVADLVRLAPAAQRFVDVIKRLKPAFEDLRLDVQQRLFRGLDQTVQRLATAWLPQLRVSLGGMADTFNGIFRDLGKNLSKPEFIENLSVGIESVRRLIERVGGALSGPFVDALGRLSRAAEPFIDALGKELTGLIEDFSAWITRLDKNGSLKKFFEDAGKAMQGVVDIGKNLASIVGSIFAILFGAEEDPEASPFDRLQEGVQRLADWFADPVNREKIQGFLTSIYDGFNRIIKWFQDPENQQKIQEWVDNIRAAVEWISTVAIPTATNWINKVQGWINKVEGWVEKFIQFRQDIRDTWASIDAVVSAGIDSLSSLVGRMYNTGQDLVRGLYDGVKSLGGWLFNKITSFVKDNIPAPIAKALGIASPSKVAAALTREVPAGMVEGMAAGASAVAAQSANLAEHAVAHLRGLTSNTPTLAATMTTTQSGFDGQTASTVAATAGSGDMLLHADIYIGDELLDSKVVRIVRREDRAQARKLAAVPRDF